MRPFSLSTSLSFHSHQVLHKPKLSFFRDYLVSVGAKLPPKPGVKEDAKPPKTTNLPRTTKATEPNNKNTKTTKTTKPTITTKLTKLTEPTKTTKPLKTTKPSKVDLACPDPGPPCREGGEKTNKRNRSRGLVKEADAGSDPQLEMEEEQSEMGGGDGTGQCTVIVSSVSSDGLAERSDKWGGGDSTDSENTKYLRSIVSGNRRSKERRDWLKQQRDMQTRQELECIVID